MQSALKLTITSRIVITVALLLLTLLLAWITFKAGLDVGYQSMLQVLIVMDLALLIYAFFRSAREKAKVRYLGQAATGTSWLVLLASILPVAAWISSLSETPCRPSDSQCSSPGFLITYLGLNPFILPPLLVTLALILIIGIIVDSTSPRARR